MAEIDSLEISIQGKMESAWQSIDALTKKLGKVPAALNNISKTPVKIDFSSKSVDSTRLKYSLEKAFQNTKIDTSKMADNLSKSFGVSAKKASEDIRGQFSDLVESVMNDSSVGSSNKAIDSIVDSIVKNGKIARADFSDSMQGLRQEYEEFYNYFKQHKIYVSDFLKSDIGKTEFNDLLERNLSNITREKGKGIKLDGDWSELSERFPGIIPKDTINAAEQVLQILQEIEIARKNIKPIPIQNLIGSDYETVVEKIKQNVEDTLESSLKNIFDNADKLYDKSATGMNIPVQINEDVITTQIQSAIRKASKIEYEPLKIDFNIDTKKLKSDLTSKLKGLDLSELSNALSQLKNISIDTKSITEMSNAISILGRKSATAGIENIPALTKAVKDMLSAFSEVPKIDSSIVQMTQSLAELARNGKAISNIKKEISDVSSGNGDSEVKKLNDSVENYREWSIEFQKNIDEMSKQYGGILNIPKDAFDVKIENLETSLNDLRKSFPDAIEEISAFENKLKELEEVSKRLKLESVEINTDVLNNQVKTKVEELRAKYKDSGMDFKFTGNFEALKTEIDSLYNQLKKLEEKERDLISTGDVYTSHFKELEENISKLRNEISILKNIKNETIEFRNILKELKVPPVLENDLTKLQSLLDKSKAKAISLKTELSNKLAKGEVIENVSDPRYRDMREEIALTGKTIDALQEKIKEVTQSIKLSSTEARAAFEDNLSKLQVPPIDETNLDKLESRLKKEEANLKKFRTNLSNDIQMGKITESIDDSGYRKAREQIALTEKQIEALRGRINQVRKTGGNFQLLLSKVSSVAKKAKSALSSVASAIKRIGLFSKSVISKLSNLVKSLIRVKKASKSLDNTTELLKRTLREALKYAGFIEISKGIKDAIKDSMDYIETLNYFDAAFDQVARKADLSSFKKMGYESADSYYKSFSERAKQLTAKMSGFTIGENGLLESTRQISLGLDPERLMNYQAMFGQMSSSMGVSAETSLKLSQALTELGADLASVKNLEFEKVWEDMASGMTGMSRTLDKYGVNIRDTNLQQELNKLGIEANINALNQNDKVLLRTIVLLNSTKYAWADLADTIEQPANQLRLIESNFQNLSRTIGSLFLPLLKTILPYVNALVIALQRLFSWLASLIGIDLSEISNAIGGADIGDALDQMDDFSGSIGEAKKEADKLNKSIRQFDELKVITTKQDEDEPGSGTGIPGGLLDAAFEDAFTKYQEVWDEAFGNLENKAQELADKIEKAFAPIKEIIQNLFSGEFLKAGENVGGVVNSILDIDWDGTEEKLTNFSENLADFFNGIVYGTDFELLGSDLNTGLETVFNTISTFLDTFNFEQLGKDAAKLIKKLFQTDGWWSARAKTFGKKIKSVIGTMKGFVDEMNKIDKKTGLNGWEQVGLELGNAINSMVKEIPWKTVGETFAGLFNGLFKAGGQFLLTVDFEQIGESVGTAINTGLGKIDWETVKETVGIVGEKLAQFLNKLITPENMRSVGVTIAETLNTAIIAIFDFFNELDFENLGESLGEGINGFTETFDFKKLFATINLIINKLKEGLVSAIETINWSETFSKIFEGLGEIDIGNIALIAGVGMTLKYGGKLLTKAVLTKAVTDKIAGGAVAAGTGGAVAAGAGGTLAAGAGGAVSAGISGIVLPIAAALTISFILWENADQIAEKLKPIALQLKEMTETLFPKLSPDYEKNRWDSSFNTKATSGFLAGSSTAEAFGKDQSKDRLKDRLMSPDPGLEGTSIFRVMQKQAEDASETIENVKQKINGSFSEMEISSDTLSDKMKGAFNITPIEQFAVSAGNDISSFGTTVNETLGGIQTSVGDVKSLTSESLAFTASDFKNTADSIKTTIEDNKIDTFPEVNWENSKTVGETKSKEIGNKMLTALKTVVKDGKESTSLALSGMIKGAVGIAKANEDLMKSVASVGAKVTNKIGSSIKENKTVLSTSISSSLQATLNVVKKDSGLLTSAANIGSAIGGKIKKSLDDAVKNLNIQIQGVGDIGLKAGLTVIGKGFAAGGFPEPYSVFAAGEGGTPEILGTVGGKTAVAGGAEITGIREAIAIAAHDEVTLLREQNKLLQLLLAKETGITQNEIGRAAQRYAEDHLARTGRPAYAM